MARGRGDGCWLRGYCGEWGDGCCGRGYFCDWGVVGAVREPSLRVGRRERGWGCCGEFRASPCSLRSRPPSRGEGGGGN